MSQSLKMQVIAQELYLNRLVTGSVHGKFSEFFAKAQSIHEKHGPFDALLCTGDFFGKDSSESEINDLVNGKIDVPLTTYFIIGHNPIPEAIQKHIESTDGEVCSNLYYLGKQGVLTTAQGLKIAFISGVYDQATSTPNTYQDTDITKLKSTRFPITAPPGVDILLSHEWPQAIHEGSALTPTGSLSTLSKPVAELSTALKPRYHFASSESVFYEREPYTNMMDGGSKDERPAEHVSRFIGLGDVLNGEKQRWFYAFLLEPISKIALDKLQARPSNTTECPFRELLVGSGQKRQHNTSEDGGSFFWGDNRESKRSAKTLGDSSLPENYVCKICNTPGHHIKECPQAGARRERTGRAPPAGYVCRICNEPGHYLNDCPEKEVRDKEREAKRGMDCEYYQIGFSDAWLIYLREVGGCWFCLSNPKVAKHLIVSIGTGMYATLARGPVVSSSDSTVPGGGHILLIPIPHYPTFRKIPMESQIEVIAELEKYKSALRRMFDEYGQDIVVFEVSREAFHGMSHAHIQVVPIPKDKIDLIETVAREQAESHGMTFIDRVPDSPEVAYFKMELPNGKSLVHIIQPRERFNLQFGRLLVTKVLGQPEREDWKACAQSEDEERKDAKTFIAAFQPFDFSL
ncbi:hypothetical protein DFQ29_008756 [Apophysomyces sp. BC1021]|nr:hypothetical protein DFQ29_008756 [Apophysomyces sp. BC1021]